ncbi:MAG: hypothetical protein ACRDYU_04480 [Actinomycetes bacterium]
MRVRLAVAVVGAMLGMALLGGCEKPTPLVTLTSGTSSVHAEAVCYAGDGGEISERACRQPASEARTLNVPVSSSVGVGVDPELADQGWRITINGQPATQQILDTTFYRFGLSPQAFRQGPLELQVATVDGRQLTGLWLFRLTQD